MITPPAPLSTWSKAWRYLLAAGVGAFVWAARAAVLYAAEPAPAQRDRIGTALLIDLVLGAATVALLPLRRRFPPVVAALAVIASTVSVAGVGALIVAIVSMATWRRRSWIVVAGVLSVAAAIVAEGLYRPWFTPSAGHGYGVVTNVIIVLTIFAAAVATGSYIGTRRDLLASLRERALTAERERALAAQVAREAERTRIAREMHDELAHRISLVALHAGALAYRENLSPAEVAATAATIQTSARLALTELRQVLGVLRDPGESAERPQPTLAELPALLADVREAGSVVRLDTPDLSGLPPELSSVAFRILQESLTNARKHAPGTPIGVHVTGTPGADLGIEIRNAVGVPLPLASGGVGLTGLRERAELIDGTLAHGIEAGGDFVVRASLPWPA